MIEKPEIADLAEIQTAFIHVTVPRNQIQEVMGPALRELMDAIAGQGIAPDGAWFTHHLKMNPEYFDFEIAVPVSNPVSHKGRVMPDLCPPGRVVRTIYHGDYEGLANAWQEFDAWIAAEGLTPGPDLWEVYTSGPEANPDPTSWRTELIRPLASA